MATIDATYFFGPINIAQKQQVGDNLTWFINEYEEKLLTDLLGFKTYDAYKAGIAEETPAQKWKDIRDGKQYTDRSGRERKWRGLRYTISGSTKKSMIANYVYWHWMENEATTTTGSGEKVSEALNSREASPVYKMVSAWNDMVDDVWELIEMLLSHEDDYPDFPDHFPCINRSILFKQNVLGI